MRLHYILDRDKLTCPVVKGGHSLRILAHKKRVEWNVQVQRVPRKGSGSAKFELYTLSIYPSVHTTIMCFWMSKTKMAED